MVVKVRVLNSSWLLSSIYASPRLEEKKLLWNNLASVVPCIIYPRLCWVTLMSSYPVMTSWGGTFLIPDGYKCLRSVWTYAAWWTWAFMGLGLLGSIKGRWNTLFRGGWIEVLLTLNGEECIQKQQSTIWPAHTLTTTLFYLRWMIMAHLVCAGPFGSSPCGCHTPFFQKL